MPVSKWAVAAGGKTVVEWRFSSGRSNGFTSSALVKIKGPKVGVTQWVTENRVVKVCEERDNYRFGFNGQEKVNEVAGVGNHTSAMFWEYDPRTTARWNLDPKPNPSVSPYATFNRNPILFSDVHGDSVNVSGLYQKDSKGNYINSERIKSFELFASTEKGKGYLLDHAQKGIKLEGVFVAGLSIEATEEGSASKNGVDVSFELGDVRAGAGAFTSSSIIGGERKSDGGRLKTRFVFPTTDRASPYWDKGTLEQTMYDVGIVAHEVFLHGDMHETRFGMNYFQEFLKDSDHSHAIFNNSAFGTHGLATMREAMRTAIGNTTLKPMSTANLQLMIDIGREVNVTQKYGIQNTEGLCDYIQRNK